MKIKTIWTFLQKLLPKKSTRKERCQQRVVNFHRQSGRKIEVQFESLRELSGIRDKIEYQGGLTPRAILAYTDKARGKIVSDIKIIKQEYTTEVLKLPKLRKELEIRQKPEISVGNNQEEDSHYIYNGTTITEEGKMSFKADVVQTVPIEVSKPEVSSILPRDRKAQSETEAEQFSSYMNFHLDKKGKQFMYEHLNGKTWVKGDPLEELQEEIKSPTNFSTNSLLYFSGKVIFFIAIGVVMLYIADVYNLLTIIRNLWGIEGFELWTNIGIPIGISLISLLFVLKGIRRWIHSDIRNVKNSPLSIKTLFVLAIVITFCLGLQNANYHFKNKQLQEQELLQEDEEDVFIPETTVISRSEKKTIIYGTESSSSEEGLDWVFYILYPCLSLFLAISAGVFEALLVVLFTNWNSFLALDKQERKVRNLVGLHRKKIDNLEQMVDIIKALLYELGKYNYLEYLLSAPYEDEDLKKIFGESPITDQTIIELFNKPEASNGKASIKKEKQ